MRQTQGVISLTFVFLISASRLHWQVKVGRSNCLYVIVSVNIYRLVCDTCKSISAGAAASPTCSVNYL